MKLSNFLLIITLLFSSSCAMLFNDEKVNVTIASAPPGADIFIDGQNYGKTPATVNLAPKNYTVTLNKQNYGSTKLTLESWVAMRESTGDKGRCVLDSMLMPLYIFGVSDACSDFKQHEYFVTIPYVGVSGGMSSGRTSSYQQNSSPYGQNPYAAPKQQQVQQGYVPQTQGNYYGSQAVQFSPADQQF